MAAALTGLAVTYQSINQIQTNENEFRTTHKLYAAVSTLRNKQ